MIDLLTFRSKICKKLTGTVRKIVDQLWPNGQYPKVIKSIIIMTESHRDRAENVFSLGAFELRCNGCLVICNEQHLKQKYNIVQHIDTMYWLQASMIQMDNMTANLSEKHQQI